MVLALLDAEFKSVSLAESRVGPALQAFAAKLKTIAPAPASTPADATPSPADAATATAAEASGSPAELLELLVQPGAWFQVFDPDRNERRWMKAVAYYAGLDCAAFAEFNGGNTLLLKSRMLLDDLTARRTLPVDLNPTARAALDRYLARAA